jgi:hypothetical protein
MALALVVASTMTTTSRSLERRGAFALGYMVVLIVGR